MRWKYLDAKWFCYEGPEMEEVKSYPLPRSRLWSF